MKRRDLIASASALAALTASALSPVVRAQPSAATVNLVSIDYDLGEVGWSSFILRVGDKSAEIGTFSYTTNALDDLIRAAITVATSAYRAELSLDGEPNEWRIILDEGWKPDMRLRVVEFPNISPRMDEQKGVVTFEARVKRDDFAHAVQKAAHDIWDKYGEDGYRAAWIGDNGFPVRALAALDAALAVPPPIEPTN